MLLQRSGSGQKHRLRKGWNDPDKLCIIYLTLAFCYLPDHSMFYGTWAQVTICGDRYQIHWLTSCSSLKNEFAHLLLPSIVTETFSAAAVNRSLNYTKCFHPRKHLHITSSAAEIMKQYKFTGPFFAMKILQIVGCAHRIPVEGSTIL